MLLRILLIIKTINEITYSSFSFTAKELAKNLQELSYFTLNVLKCVSQCFNHPHFNNFYL